jgi:predicted HD superfamily hydrolase involved in NAD metabolism
VQESQQFEQYLAQLAEYLGPKRLGHSVNVAKAARMLALRFSPDLADRAELAGLLHDNAKGLTDAELIERAQSFDIEVSPAERSFPALLHGKVGAALLQDRFGVDDGEIAIAVADHVTGRKDMGLFSQILFVADQIAKDRNFAGVEELRQIAAGNLERAVFLVARNKLHYIVSKKRMIEPKTVAVYNEYLARETQDGT